MNKKTLSKIVVSVAAATPMLAFAADDIAGIFDSASGVLTIAITFAFLLATAIFLYGVITYLAAGGDESKASEGKKYIIWGIIGLFAMIAIWGVVWAIKATFALPSTGIPTKTL